uniref:Uncharacterized protein n=1 Tax=Helianthus annuus TaxID=4232 RepID=A0A251SGK7_HELAN
MAAAAAMTFPASLFPIRHPTPTKSNVPDMMAVLVFEESEPFGLTRNSGEVPVKIPAITF